MRYTLLLVLLLICPALYGEEPNGASATGETLPDPEIPKFKAFAPETVKCKFMVKHEGFTSFFLESIKRIDVKRLGEPGPEDDKTWEEMEDSFSKSKQATNHSHRTSTLSHSVKDGAIKENKFTVIQNPVTAESTFELNISETNTPSNSKEQEQIVTGAWDDELRFQIKSKESARNEYFSYEDNDHVLFKTTICNKRKFKVRQDFTSPDCKSRGALGMSTMCGMTLRINNLVGEVSAYANVQSIFSDRGLSDCFGFISAQFDATLSSSGDDAKIKVQRTPGTISPTNIYLPPVVFGEETASSVTGSDVTVAVFPNSNEAMLLSTHSEQLYYTAPKSKTYVFNSDNEYEYIFEYRSQINRFNTYADGVKSAGGNDYHASILEAEWQLARQSTKIGGYCLNCGQTQPLVFHKTRK